MLEQRIVRRRQAVDAGEDGARRRDAVVKQVVEEGLRVEFANAQPFGQGVSTRREVQAAVPHRVAQAVHGKAVHREIGSAIGQVQRDGELAAHVTGAAGAARGIGLAPRGQRVRCRRREAGRAAGEGRVRRQGLGLHLGVWLWSRRQDCRGVARLARAVGAGWRLMFVGPGRAGLARSAGRRPPGRSARGAGSSRRPCRHRRR
mmetsp:Transcript_39196/g.92154  ORF Transcript_39196/g.92154 Transcript_39196/m.92154 type:complete len:203 (+) Transcript_39196:2555-3163(+)